MAFSMSGTQISSGSGPCANTSLSPCVTGTQSSTNTSTHLPSRKKRKPYTPTSDTFVDRNIFMKSCSRSAMTDRGPSCQQLPFLPCMTSPASTPSLKSCGDGTSSDSRFHATTCGPGKGGPEPCSDVSLGGKSGSVHLPPVALTLASRAASASVGAAVRSPRVRTRGTPYTSAADSLVAKRFLAMRAVRNLAQRPRARLDATASLGGRAAADARAAADGVAPTARLATDPAFFRRKPPAFFFAAPPAPIFRTENLRQISPVVLAAAEGGYGLPVMGLVAGGGCSVKTPPVRFAHTVGAMSTTPKISF
mmetsp:Transcript_8327/g.26597  ORF Transcript_8327/g.26597 Transcript_8327/m.26597 type:complete len:307 (-) Transcript_8327:314-1234(-)